jgi:enoyl-CoA hydratase/carnithine racemase
LGFDVVAADLPNLPFPDQHRSSLSRHPSSDQTPQTCNRTGLLYTGRAMDGVEAERWGFYNRLCAPEQVLTEAQKLAATLADGPTFAHAMTKRCIHQEWSMSIDDAIEAEAICMQTRDYGRAYRAFAEEQRPVFEGN